MTKRSCKTQPSPLLLTVAVQTTSHGGHVGDLLAGQARGWMFLYTLRRASKANEYSDTPPCHSDSVNGLAPLPFDPSYDFESFGNTFEDPFSYPARPVYDVPADTHEPFNEESPEQEELDNKLLGFSATLPKARVIDGTGNFAETSLSAELLGMFFVAEDVFGGENTGRPLELTCYRRNLWQCSGQVTLSRHVSHIMNEQGQQLPVFELAASISAIESIEGKQTEIISIPWKSANGDDTKSPSAPLNVALDLSAGQELDHNRVSLPVSWKRLQFKHATANNGRRKGLQQHYVVQINLLGKVNGEFVKIAEIQSGPVIVRGRSPRNFDSRKDVALSGDKKVVEKRTTGTSTDAPTPVPKTESDEGLPQNLPNYQSRANTQVRSGALDTHCLLEAMRTLADSGPPDTAV